MKKKGSALILSILMLSFFMTITLTMYYIARNRNKRSIYKIQGMKISSSLDSGSAIAHYELYLADEYVSKGHLYATNESSIDYRGDNITYLAPTNTTRYISEIVTTDGAIKLVPTTGKHYTGIVLNNYNEYFGAKWDPTIAGTEIEVTTDSSINDIDILTQPWLAEDKVIDGEIVSRAWLNNTGEKIVRLWTEAIESSISVGGYTLTTVNGIYKDGSSIVAPIEPSKLDMTTSTSIELTYKKIISIDKTNIEEENGTENYEITYIETVNVTPSGSSIVINSDELNSMTVEKLK